MLTRNRLSRTRFVLLRRFLTAPVWQLGLLVLAGALAAASWGLARVSAKRATQPAESTPSLGALLKPDGTLDLARGFQGGLNAQGYRMEYAANGAPRFVPAAPTTAGWDPQFVNANGVQRIANVVAVSGTDIYLGGDFTTAGATIISNIAKWDGSSWSSLGSGVNGPVYALAVSGGDLYVGGDFTTAGGAPANNIAKWNGGSWSALGSGVSGGSSDYVTSLTSSGSDVYAGGRFTTAGGAPASNIAKWNGSAWSALGSGISGLGGAVYALAIIGNNVYAGGAFSMAGGNLASCIARWDGSAWSALGSGVTNQVRGLAVIGSDLYVAGQFTTAGGVPANNIAKWNGSAWSALGGGVTMANGSTAGIGGIVVVGANVYVVGSFDTAGGSPAKSVAVWNGSAWAPMGNGLERGGITLSSGFLSMAASGTDVYVAAAITKSGNTEINRIAKWNGSAWSSIGSASNSPNNYVYALAVIGSNLYVGGEFDFVGGMAANNIARWNGSSWSTLGSGLDSAAYAMAVIGTDLYVGGFFTTAGGNPANYIARWNGSAWSPLGSGVSNGYAVSLAVSGTNLYVGGTFTTAGGIPANRIARWDGGAWSALGSGMNGIVGRLAVSGNDLYASGNFTNAGGVAANNIAKWNGTTWSALGSGVNGEVAALAASGNDLYVGGAFTQAGGNAATGLAKWNGSSWSGVGGLSGGVRCLLPVGSDLYVGGFFSTTGGNPTTNLAKWNGSAWTVLSTQNSIYDVPDTLALQGTNLFVGGQFTTLGGTISHYFGRFVPCVSSLTVNNTGDGADATPGDRVCETATGNGQCTLRAAIQEANALTACVPLTINFSVTGTINTATALPSIVHPNLTISGPGANQLTVSAVPSDHQIFVVSTGNINLSLAGLTITGGFAGLGTNAGAIEFNSTNGQLNLTACALLNNGGTVFQGQIYSNQSGGITITGSTISGNPTGDGITIDRTPLSLVNSTISGNARYGIRANLSAQPTSVTLLNSTIANSGLNGVYYSAGPGLGSLITKNSILAGNQDPQILFGPGVTLTSQGNNLCGDASLTPTAAGDLLNANPLLAPLGDYGGPTPTHALLPGSPAIDAGMSSGAPASDQRGIARVGNVDIGAFESRGFTLTLNSGNNQSAVTSTAFANPLSVAVSSAFSEPVNGGQVTFTPPGSGASAIIAGTPATISGGNAVSGTVTANALIGGPYNVAATASGATPTINFSLTNLNSAPTFTPAAAITRQQGSPAGAAITVGTVSDAQTAAGSLTVTQITGGTATGINVTGITNTNGTITASVSAACTAVGGTVRFQVSDGGSTSTGDLQVNVTANTPPSVTYANASVNAGAATTNNTATATDNGGIAGYAVQAQGAYTGTISVNSSGLVSLSNAAPVGTHVITIRATDNCGATTDAQFTLTVSNNLPTITPAAALTRQQSSAGTVSTIATVNDGETSVGNLLVTASTIPTGITVTSITNTAGAITANVAAGCNAAIGANTVVLTVTDSNNGTATANLTVNVTANTAPTLTYSQAAVNAGAATTNTPTMATDNGSITGYAVQSAGTYAGTISVNSSGVVSIGNATPVGSHTITIRATDNCGLTADATFTLTVGNNPPTITPAAALTRQQGSAGSVSTVATVSDGETPVGSLVVMATSVPTGITLTALTNTKGTITANVAASCTATVGANTIVLTVTDSNSGTATANLIVNVTANSAPTLTYANVSVNAGAATSNSPTSATDNGSITSYAVQSPGTYAGTIVVNSSGVVSLSNAAPVGSHTITIRATDNCGATTDAQFTLTIGNNLPTITPAAALTRQQGTAGTISTIATVSDNDTPPGNLIVTATTVPVGLTVTVLTNNSGTITANIAANCTATMGANTIVLTVTDSNNGTATGNLIVNVTANGAPSLTYPHTDVALNTATTINPTTASDNGSVTGFSIVSVTPPLTSAPTVNAAGVVSVSNAAPFGSHTITVRATDNCGTTTDASFTLNVGCGTINVTPATLINGLTFISYNATLSANGGTGAYTFSLVSGTLPAGLSLNGNQISGTPNTAGASTFTLRATDGNGCFGEQTYTLLIGSTGLMYYPLARPVRLLDTRPGLSPNACFQPNAPIPGGTARLQPARGTCEGLTIPANATTITGNITTVQSGGGFLTIYPSDAPQPLVANTNYMPNEVLNNAFTVGVGAQDGAVKIFVTSDTDVVVDVTGYYAPASASGLYFHPLPRPVRLLETRAGFTGCSAPATPLPGGVNTLQQGTGACAGLSIPNEALALVGNATTVNPAGIGYLTLYPANAAQPLIASSNYSAGQTVNGPFTVGLSPSGQFKIYTQQTTELVIDITGYYSAQASDVNGQGLLFTSLGSPLRLLDTRAGQQGCYTPGAPMAGGAVYTQQTQSPCTNLTPTARALIGNATVVNTTGEGYLTFWPGDAAQPLVATSNFVAGQVFNRYFAVGLAADGSFKRFALRTTDLVVDISGFFAP